MTDPATPAERPRPAYGEYATPEEQAARIRRPEVTTALENGQSPAVAPAAPRPPVTPAAPTTSGPAAPGAPAARRPRFFDRIFTFALLGYGLFSVLGAIPAAADYSQFASTFLGVFGVDEALSDPAGARGWGLAAALVLGIGWLGTFALTWINLRAARISFWIPLVGGFVVNMISAVLLIAPLAADPVVWTALQNGLMG
ncbi:DUF6264 family protein [Microbacterium sp. cx-55]|uniref:DUF6264 family protein n=1 Tax=Microbacterium sp. cx-55 TaxID=2875948 RepID=UPI001CBA7EA8|nr:DUF6264 family protein [Microbacterium sp. cx-55]MBZ4485846.1 DUF6264 family protein [Microbacterium sp. cx-55]UGB34277.1 DUF6264 family protein [Microbacterium sp. cx-55]